MNRLVGGLYFMYINLQVTNKPLNFVVNSMEVPTLQTLKPIFGTIRMYLSLIVPVFNHKLLVY